jgi:hypothetical protein
LLLDPIGDLGSIEGIVGKFGDVLADLFRFIILEFEFLVLG